MGIWGWYVTQEPKFSGLMLNHKGLRELELKKHKKCFFWSNLALFECFFGSGPFKTLPPIPQIGIGTLGADE